MIKNILPAPTKFKDFKKELNIKYGFLIDCF